MLPYGAALRDAAADARAAMMPMRAAADRIGQLSATVPVHPPTPAHPTTWTTCKRLLKCF
jgi:hypothetical protein